MTKEKLTSEVKKYVSQTAQHKIPKITANAIYFIFKQNDSSIKRRNYISIFKKVKEMLRESFGWSLVDIHKCFCELNKLMEYFREKS